MAWENLKQRSFADQLACEHGALKELDDINELIQWDCIEQHFSEIHTKRCGSLAWRPLLMFKALLLQSWHNLSDPGLEKQLARDLLFRRFVGLNLADSVPDHSSIWRFRQQLEKQDLLTKLLAEINHQLSQHGLYIRTGEISIVDASIVEAHRNRPNKDQGRQ